MTSRSKSICVLTYVDPSNSVSRGKNNLLLIILLQRIDDTMFDYQFADQHKFDYFEPSDKILDVQIKWLIPLNDGTLRIHLNTKSND
jgi:hypothetical protein